VRRPIPITKSLSSFRKLLNFFRIHLPNPAIATILFIVATSTALPVLLPPILRGVCSFSLAQRDQVIRGANGGLSISQKECSDIIREASGGIPASHRVRDESTDETRVTRDIEPDGTRVTRDEDPDSTRVSRNVTFERSIRGMPSE
jgi:hypothetical protein